MPPSPFSILRQELPEASEQLQATLNPFTNRSVLSGPRFVAQVIVGSLLLVPLRLTLILALVPVVLLLAKSASSGLTKGAPVRPFGPARRAALALLRWCIRLVLLLSGFWVIRETGSPDPLAAVVAPKHVSYWETLFFASRISCSPVAGSNNVKGPVGWVLLAMQALLLDRSDPESRKRTADSIRERCRLFQERPGETPPLLVFPEGTTANGALITFKEGAFLPGAPVQPVLLSYGCDGFDPSWAGGLEMPWHLLLTLCQWSNVMEVRWLPTVWPSEEEKKDARLFADNVRALMSRESGLPMTEHGYEDVLLRVDAQKLHLGPLDVTVRQLAGAFGKVDLPSLRKMMVAFKSADRRSSGALSVGEFASAMGLPVSPALREVFGLIDTDGSGSINFRQWLLSMAVITRHADAIPEETLAFAFQLFDKDGNGRIDEAEFFSLLNSLRRDDYDGPTCAKIFSAIDRNQDGFIDFAEFKAYAKSNPVVAQLFTQALHRRDLYKPGSLHRPDSPLRRSSN